jgi:hypothetical protein
MLIALNRPPGSSRIWSPKSPDLFDLIDGTSNDSCCGAGGTALLPSQRRDDGRRYMLQIFLLAEHVQESDSNCRP